MAGLQQDSPVNTHLSAPCESTTESCRADTSASAHAFPPCINVVFMPVVVARMLCCCAVKALMFSQDGMPICQVCQGALFMPPLPTGVANNENTWSTVQDSNQASR